MKDDNNTCPFTLSICICDSLEDSKINTPFSGDVMIRVIVEDRRLNLVKWCAQCLQEKTKCTMISFYHCKLHLSLEILQ